MAAGEGALAVHGMAAMQASLPPTVHPVEHSLATASQLQVAGVVAAAPPTSHTQMDSSPAATPAAAAPVLSLGAGKVDEQPGVDPSQQAPATGFEPGSPMDTDAAGEQAVMPGAEQAVVGGVGGGGGQLAAAEGAGGLLAEAEDEGGQMAVVAEGPGGLPAEVEDGGVGGAQADVKDGAAEPEPGAVAEEVPLADLAALCQDQLRQRLELAALAGLGPVLLPAAESACEQLVSQGVGANGPEPGQSPEEAADAVWRKANDILWSAAEAVGDDCLLAAGYAADAEALCYGLPAVAVPAVRAACGALLHAADRLELHGAVPQLRGAAPRVFSAASLAMLAIISQASCRHAPSAKPGQVATGFPGLQPLLTAAATALDRGDGRPAGLASYGTVLSQVVLMLGEEHSLALYGCGAEQTMHRPSRAAKSVAMKWMKGSTGLAGMGDEEASPVQHPRYTNPGAAATRTEKRRWLQQDPLNLEEAAPGMSGAPDKASVTKAGQERTTYRGVRPRAVGGFLAEIRTAQNERR
ncbi:hypothetical protein V8C86DRAFT_641941 [Haematococcus lacustris]